MEKWLKHFYFLILLFIIILPSSTALSQLVRFEAEEYRTKEKINTLDSIQVSYFEYDVPKQITFKNDNGELNLPFFVDITGSTGIELDNKNSFVTLNFRNSQILLTSGKDYNSMSVSIYNYMGQVLKSQTFNSQLTEHTISFTDYPEGAYFALINIDSKIKCYSFHKIKSEKLLFNLISKTPFSEFKMIAFKKNFEPCTIYKTDIISVDTIRFGLKKYPIEQYYSFNLDIFGIELNKINTVNKQIAGHPEEKTTEYDSFLYKLNLDFKTNSFAYCYKYMDSNNISDNLVFEFYKRKSEGMNYNEEYSICAKLIINRSEKVMDSVIINVKFNSTTSSTTSNYYNVISIYDLTFTQVPYFLTTDNSILSEVKLENFEKNICDLVYYYSSFYHSGNDNTGKVQKTLEIIKISPDAKLKITLKPE